MNKLAALGFLAAVVLAVSPAARKAVRAVGGAVLGLAALAVEHRRHRNQPARVEVPQEYRWRVRLSTPVDGRLVPIAADGEVVGPWRTAVEVQQETLRRLAETGKWPADGPRIYARAWPVDRAVA